MNWVEDGSLAVCIHASCLQGGNNKSAHPSGLNESVLDKHKLLLFVEYDNHSTHQRQDPFWCVSSAFR